MQNKNKHSIKCNKRDKTYQISVVYRVEHKEYPSKFRDFSTKYDAFVYLSCIVCDFDYHVVKITKEEVLS